MSELGDFSARDAKAHAKLEKTFREARENERAFQAELAAVINKYSREGRSNTPDFILAGYLVNCLEAYDVAMEGLSLTVVRPFQQKETNNAQGNDEE